MAGKGSSISRDIGGSSGLMPRACENKTGPVLGMGQRAAGNGFDLSVDAVQLRGSEGCGWREPVSPEVVIKGIHKRLRLFVADRPKGGDRGLDAGSFQRGQ